VRIGYLGPEGTFTHEALLAAAPSGQSTAPGRRRARGRGAAMTTAAELVALPTIYDAVLAVQDGFVDQALVPIENSLEGSVNATLDALVMETGDVDIVGEVVHPIHHCLIARAPLELDRIETVVSHPQASAQCARFLRAELPQARVLAGSSTADAVRMVAEHDGSWGAVGNRLAAARYGCEILRSGVEDRPGNETRFVWLAARIARRDDGAERPDGRCKTVVVFWGPGTDSPGWLVRCLSEFSQREVNLTRIESRPRKDGLGSYMFFCDLEGHVLEVAVAGALAALRGHVEELRVLGSFSASAGA
jgi:prephenate dehydratase